MIDHLSLGTTDLSRSVEFYRWAFAPLGFVLQHANEKEAAFGPGTDWTFWLYPASSVKPIEGIPSRSPVRHGRQWSRRGSVRERRHDGSRARRTAGHRRGLTTARSFWIRTGTGWRFWSER
jgi:catechol 2,3-dioxygenase-like lactoylglutathione lyase family enzyme